MASDTKAAPSSLSPEVTVILTSVRILPVHVSIRFLTRTVLRSKDGMECGLLKSA